MNKYQEQIDRLERYYSRFRKINEGKAHDLPSEYYQDDVFAFFLNCYHLKDWIINDSSLEISSNSVEDFINQNEELRICADICNSHKHLKLNRKPRSNQAPQFSRRIFGVRLGTCETEIKAQYIIETNSGEIDAYKLAAKCLSLWKKFVQENA